MEMFWFGIVRFEIVGEKLLNGGKKLSDQIRRLHQKRIRARSHAAGPGLGSVVRGHDENDGRIRGLFQATRDFRAI